MKRIRRKRHRNKKNNLSSSIEISEAIEFQEWFARMGGLIENHDMEKVIQKFKQK